MDSNSLAVSRFQSPVSPQAFMPRPASPLVLQRLLQLLEKLDQSMNELAVRHSQPLDTRSVEMMPVKVKPVESKQVEVKTAKSKSPATERRVKVNRSKLLDIFD